MLISNVISLDTRQTNLQEGPMLNGTTCLEYLTEGVINKKRFFHDLPTETILYIDVHDPLSQETLDWLHSYPGIDTVVFQKHTKVLNGQYDPKWHDTAYNMALALAHGDYICHWDADMAGFAKDQTVIEDWLKRLDEVAFVSYPSRHSPHPVHDPRFTSYWWASTRFMLCKKESIDTSEIQHCLNSDAYLYGKYGDREVKCGWLEHILGIIHDQKGVWYPPMDHDKYMVFSFASYYPGCFAELNKMGHDEVKQKVLSWNDVNYPCDVRATP